MAGWVSIERKLFTDPFFASEAMSEREAWVWMIARAAYEDTTHRVGQVMCDVPRGSFMVTLRELQSAFMWGSDTKVRNFLKRLEDEGMIERTVMGSRNAPKTHVTICNYEYYQSASKTENAPKTHRERTKNAVNKQGNNKQPSEAKASSVVVPEDRDIGFDAFWVQWPDKKAKATALKAWRKLSYQDKRAAYAALISGWFERWRAGSPDASPIHAATYLNQKRWEDAQQSQLLPIQGGRHGSRDHDFPHPGRAANSPDSDWKLRSIARAAGAFDTPGWDRGDG